MTCIFSLMIDCFIKLYFLFNDWLFHKIVIAILWNRPSWKRKYKSGSIYLVWSVHWWFWYPGERDVQGAVSSAGRPNIQMVITFLNAICGNRFPPNLTMADNPFFTWMNILFEWMILDCFEWMIIFFCCMNIFTTQLIELLNE